MLVLEAIALPCALEVDYLTAFNVSCLFVAPAPSGKPTAIRLARNPSVALGRLRKNFDCDIAWLSWTFNNTAQDLLAHVAHAQRVTPPRLFQITGEEAVFTINLQCLEHGIELWTNSSVLSRTRAGIERLNQQLAEAKENGGLKFFNARYKQHRLAEIAQGRRPKDYTTAYDDLRRQLIRTAATKFNARLELPPAAELLKKIFDP